MSDALFDLAEMTGPVYFAEYAKADTCCGCGSHVSYGTPQSGYPDVNYQAEGWTIRCRDCREKVGWVHPGVYWAGPEYEPHPEWSGDCPVISSVTSGRSGRHCYQFGEFERCTCAPGAPCHFCGREQGGGSEPVRWRRPTLGGAALS